MKIVVTGGASGLGEALVHCLADHEVWILDIKAPAAMSGNHQYIETNLSDPAAIDQAVAALPDEIDALANVAGIASAPDPTLVVAVNFLGLRHITSQVIPRFQGSGRIVNVSSIAGRDWQGRFERIQPLLATASFAEGLAWCQENVDTLSRDPYTFSKRAVTAHTMLAAGDAVRSGYRVNCISPGPIETPLYPEFESLMGEAQSDWMKAQTGRIASPTDIAEVAALLLTGNCGWLNGVDIPVDGGYSAGLASGWIDLATSPVMQQRAR